MILVLKFILGWVIFWSLVLLVPLGIKMYLNRNNSEYWIQKCSLCSKPTEYAGVKLCSSCRNARK